MSSEIGVARDSVTVPLPKKVSVTVRPGAVRVKGPLGEVERGFPTDAVKLTPGEEAVTLTLQIPPNRKRSRSLLNTWEAHLRNLARGVTVGFEAKLKVVAAHFPMRVSVKDSDLLIENFLGEKFPRTAPLTPGVAATVEGDIVTLSGIDVEKVGQCAASIERTTRIREYDPRVFQDGIYIVERARPKEA